MSYRRILLKLSGEALAGQGQPGLSEAALQFVKREIQSVHELGIETALVIGGGNFLRGSDIGFLHRSIADQLGMFATVMNAIALKELLLRANINAVVQSAVTAAWTGPINPTAANRALAANAVVIYAGGTGNPYVTTDTAAAIRACEIDADLLVKATQVDGVYSADPKTDPTATRFERVGYDEVIEKQLAVMDTAAFDICRGNNIPIAVYNFHSEGALRRLVEGEPVGSIVSS